MNGDSSEAIKEILQFRLLNLTKEFKTVLQARTESIKKNQSRRNEISIVSDMKSGPSKKTKPSFMDEPDQQA